MAVSAEPEIRRCSLTSSVLQLKCLGQDFQELDFMDKPDYDSGTYLYHNPSLSLLTTLLSCLGVQVTLAAWRTQQLEGIDADGASDGRLPSRPLLRTDRPRI